MNEHVEGFVGRRRFLRESVVAVVGIGGSCLIGTSRGEAVVATEDSPNTHNMLVFGQRTVFLSHLPMFRSLNAAKTAFTSPHRFQVIVEATFTNAGSPVQDVYFKDRQDHAAVRIYTLNPQEDFVLSQIFAPEPGAPRLTSFPANVFRGHFERQGIAIPALQNTKVSVTRVVHAREFNPKGSKPDELEYVLFGKGAELFAAHAISAPPDFDHVLAVALDGRELTSQELTQEMRVTIKGRKNVSANRLREGQTFAGQLTVGGKPAAGSSDVQLRVAREFYFEEGELFVPATFDDTEEEKKTPS
jgi:hypothetical protein